MATTSNILTLIKYCCGKQNVSMLEYDEFASFLHQYAQHHVDENQELLPFSGFSFKEALADEIKKLCDERMVFLNAIRGKDYIYAVPVFVEKYANIYAQIEKNTTVPFPNISELHKSVPSEIFAKREADSIIYEFLEKQGLSDKILYAIYFSKSLPALILPGNVTMSDMLTFSLRKIQSVLKKSESHDYFQRKLTISNPGKELSIKNFFNAFVSNPQTCLENLKENGENFYYWSQLCYFVKQDYSKLKDLTPEDTTILQSIAIIEIATSFYKAKAAKRMQKEAAFETLAALLENPPYYYSLDDIIKMKDKNGVPLLGQYSDKDLDEYLKRKTTESPDSQLPELLVFKTENQKSFYIYKKKVMPLAMRLTNDVRVLVRESLIKAWYQYMLEYEVLPEMKDNMSFEKCLEREISALDPILYALLSSPFLGMIDIEDKTVGRMNFFRGSDLIPYSEILLLSRHELLADAKLKLPFWYTIPILSLILQFIFKKSHEKIQKDSERAVSLEHLQEKKDKEMDSFKKKDAEDSIDKNKHKRRMLRKAAMELESQFVPENSTLDIELNGYLHEWNDRIGTEVFDNLTEDVNVLIRDYFRKTLKTIKTESFTKERIEHLADALVEAPALLKIKNHPALKHYIELYILQTVKNMPSR